MNTYQALIDAAHKVRAIALDSGDAELISFAHCAWLETIRFVRELEEKHRSH